MFKACWKRTKEVAASSLKSVTSVPTKVSVFFQERRIKKKTKKEAKQSKKMMEENQRRLDSLLESADESQAKSSIDDSSSSPAAVLVDSVDKSLLLGDKNGHLMQLKDETSIIEHQRDPQQPMNNYQTDHDKLVDEIVLAVLNSTADEISLAVSRSTAADPLYYSSFLMETSVVYTATEENGASLEKKRLNKEAIKKLEKRQNRIEVNSRRMDSLSKADAQVKASSVVCESNSPIITSPAWFEEAIGVMIEGSDLYREQRTMDEKHRDRCYNDIGIDEVGAYLTYIRMIPYVELYIYRLKKRIASSQNANRTEDETNLFVCIKKLMKTAIKRRWDEQELNVVICQAIGFIFDRKSQWNDQEQIKNLKKWARKIKDAFPSHYSTIHCSRGEADRDLTDSATDGSFDDDSSDSDRQTNIEFLNFDIY